MVNNSVKRNLGRVVVEYENLDVPPVYVESVQGMQSPGGVLHVSFLSERIKTLETVSADVIASEDGTDVLSQTLPDPFGLDTEVLQIVRRVEANLIFTRHTIERLIPWLQRKLKQMQKDEAGE